jgi:hypothetical protein
MPQKRSANRTNTLKPHTVDKLTGEGRRKVELKDIVERMVKGIKQIDDKIDHGRKSPTKWGPYLGGIGSAYEIDIRDELMEHWNRKYTDSTMIAEVSYPEKELTGRCDLCISETSDTIRGSDIYDWGIELKSIANIGDNGGVNNFGIGKVVSPYKAEKSSVHDCDKLRKSNISKKKAVVMFGFEFDSESVEYCRIWEEENQNLIPEHQIPPNVDAKGKPYKFRWERMKQVLETNTYENSWEWEAIVPIFEGSCKAMGIELQNHVNIPFSGLTRHPVYRKIRFLGWEVK